MASRAEPPRVLGDGGLVRWPDRRVFRLLSIRASPRHHLWIVSVAIFCAASLLNALNFSVTAIDLRAKA